jgi:hypothetical protein
MSPGFARSRTQSVSRPNESKVRHHGHDLGVSEAATILAIAVPGAVAALSIGTNVYLSRRQSNDTRTLADRQDARDVLAAGALQLGRTKIAMKEAFTTFGIASSKGDWPQDFPDQIGRLQDATDELEGALAGARIRFSAEEPLVKELEAALKSAKALIVVYATTRISDLKGENDWAGMPKRRRDPYGDALILSQAFDDQKKAFLAAAHGAAGAKLD